MFWLSLTWHTPLDVWTTFTDDDFRLGLNAAQTTLAALSELGRMGVYLMTADSCLTWLSGAADSNAAA